ncbi:MAG: YkgJ family cysteine cluster protein [Wolinella sp.]
MSTLITKDGFLFAFAPDSCAECGGFCCVGESGYIFVNHTEIDRIAALLGLCVDEFGSRYLKRVGARYSLIEKREVSGDGYACIFFDENKRECMIYAERPKQCREFPFWESNRLKKFNEVSEQCPFLKPL